VAGYQTIEALRPILHRGPPPMPIVDRALVRAVEKPVIQTRKNGISEQTIAKIIAMREAGASIRKVRAACGVSFYTVRHYSKGSARPDDAAAGKEFRAEFAARLRRSGFTYREIAKELGVSYCKVHTHFNERPSRKGREVNCKMIERVAVITGYTAAELKKASNGDYRANGDHARARHLLFWLLHRYRDDLSIAGIGKRCGGFSRKSVSAGIVRGQAVADAIALQDNLRPLTATRLMWAAKWPASV
jgi:lambda repressor-like predicted transcriptional regulator